MPTIQIADKPTLDDVKTIVNDLKTTTGAVNTNVTTLQSRGSIKRIQRGKAALPYSSSNKLNTVAIPLSGFNDINKMVVIINGGALGYSGSSYSDDVITIENLTLNTLTLSAWYLGGISASVGHYVSYQVVEYY